MHTSHQPQPSATLRIGCAVWGYKGWLGDLLPAGSKSSDLLRLYSRRLTTVEGNTTFYATPAADTVRRWQHETPPGFQFCWKLPRDISHSGQLCRQFGLTTAFVQRMAMPEQRTGPFFLQLPPSYSPQQLPDLAGWLAAWAEQLGAYRLAVEVRHPDWYSDPAEPALMELLERYTVGRVLMDVRPIRELASDAPADQSGALLDDARERKPDVPLHPLRSGGVSMLRYIGHPDPARNAGWLDEWAARLVQWLQQGTDVYAFMHCPDESRSPALCRALYHRMAQQISLPPLPWDALATAQPAVQQQTMF